MLIDTHTHLWDHLSPAYPWLGPEQGPAYDTFNAEHLTDALLPTPIDRAVIVEAASTVSETRELLQVAAKSPVVAGVIGWVEITSDEVAVTLDALRRGDGGEYLRGVRIQLAADSPFPSAAVVRGARAVAAAGLVVDLLITWRTLEAAAALARRVPECCFVVDHLAYPADDPAETAAWRDALGALSPIPNLRLKLSAVRPQNKDDASFAISLLGPERMIFGSDWPLCLRYGSYAESILTAYDVVEPAWHRQVFGKNAIDFYGLQVGPDDRSS